MNPLLLLLGGGLALKAGADKKERLAKEERERKEDRALKKRLIELQIKNAETKASTISFNQSFLDLISQYGFGTSQQEQPGIPSTPGAETGLPIGQEAFGPQSLLDQLAGGQPQRPRQGGALPPGGITGLLTNPRFLAMAKAGGMGDYASIAKFLSSRARGQNIEESIDGEIWVTNVDPITKEVLIPPRRKKEVAKSPLPIKTEAGTFQHMVHPYTGVVSPTTMQPGGGAVKIAPSERYLPPKAIGSATRAKIGLLRTMEQNLDELLRTFEPEYAGLEGVARSLKLDSSGMVPGVGADPKFAAWRMMFESIKGMERHESFGAAFTKTEQIAFRKMFASRLRHPENFKAEVKQFLDMVKRKRKNVEEASTGSMEEIRSENQTDSQDKKGKEKKRFIYDIEGNPVQ